MSDFLIRLTYKTASLLETHLKFQSSIIWTAVYFIGTFQALTHCNAVSSFILPLGRFFLLRYLWNRSGEAEVFVTGVVTIVFSQRSYALFKLSVHRSREKDYLPYIVLSALSPFNGQITFLRPICQSLNDRKIDYWVEWSPLPPTPHRPLPPNSFPGHDPGAYICLVHDRRHSLIPAFKEDCC